MTVYVDDMFRTALGQYGRMKMSHMFADTTAELLTMADLIGVHRRWLQHGGAYREHFDIVLVKRGLAVDAGVLHQDHFILTDARVGLTYTQLGTILRKLGYTLQGSHKVQRRSNWTPRRARDDSKMDDRLAEA